MLSLLPPELKEARRTRSALINVAVIYLIVIALVGLAIAGLMTWGFMQQSDISDRRSQIEQLTSQRRAKNEIVTKASFVEDRLRAATTAQEKYRWEAILNEIASATPTDTVLTSTRVATTAQGASIDIAISGSTFDRRSIVLYRDKLEASDAITKATILSLSESIVDNRKVFSFSLSATYTPVKGEE